jgi:hypothetical protein
MGGGAKSVPFPHYSHKLKKVGGDERGYWAHEHVSKRTPNEEEKRTVKVQGGETHALLRITKRGVRDWGPAQNTQGVAGGGGGEEEEEER